MRALGRGRPDLELFALTDALYDGLEAELAAGDENR